MDKFLTKKAKLDWKNCDLGEAVEDTNNNNISTMNNAASASIQTSMDFVVKGILELKDINSVGECILELKENRHLRIYVDKFGSLILEDEGLLTFLSLCISVLPSGEAVEEKTTGKLESLELTLKVDRLTEELHFDYSYLQDLDVTISSEEDYRGMVVYKYFCTRVPTEGFKFEITVTMKMKPQPSSSQEMVKDAASKDIRASLSDVKWKAEDGTPFDVLNFFMAAHSEIMTMAIEEGSKGAKSFDPKVFVHAILEWMYLGEINGLTSKWVQEMFQNISTGIQLQELKMRLLEEAGRISYGDKGRKKGMNLRIKLGKLSILKPLTVFIQEFAEILGPNSNQT